MDVLPDGTLDVDDAVGYDGHSIDSHHDLESVEAPGFRCLDFGAELLDEILRYNSVRRRKKRQHDR